MPSSLQYDNTAPDEYGLGGGRGGGGRIKTWRGHRYFRTMVVIFEEKVQLYSSQMDELQSHLTVGGGGPVFTHQSESERCAWLRCSLHAHLPLDLIDILQTQYKPFLVLAAQLQTLHEQVEVKGKSPTPSLLTLCIHTHTHTPHTHTTHTHVHYIICCYQSLREQYLTYRYVFLQDTTDVFEERRKYVKLGM